MWDTLIFAFHILKEIMEKVWLFQGVKHSLQYWDSVPIQYLIQRWQRQRWSILLSQRVYGDEVRCSLMMQDYDIMGWPYWKNYLWGILILLSEGINGSFIESCNKEKVNKDMQICDSLHLIQVIRISVGVCGISLKRVWCVSLVQFT